MVCPNVTIKNRLAELDPLRGDASLYRTRDLVPERLMADLAKGRVLVFNWHAFEPQSMTTGGVCAKVVKAELEVKTRETIRIGPKTTAHQGSRYITPEDLKTQTAAGYLKVLEEVREKGGALKEVKVEIELATLKVTPPFSIGFSGATEDRAAIFSCSMTKLITPIASGRKETTNTRTKTKTKTKTSMT